MANSGEILTFIIGICTLIIIIGYETIHLIQDWKESKKRKEKTQ